MAAQVSITQPNDADFCQVFKYTLPDGVTPISLVGATFVMTVRRTAADSGVLLRVSSTLSSAGQITLFDAPNGRFQVFIAKAAIQAMPVGVWVQSLVANLPAAGGVPAQAALIWEGNFEVDWGPSR